MANPWRSIPLLTAVLFSASLAASACAPAAMSQPASGPSVAGARPLPATTSPADAVLTARLDSVMRAAFPADQPGAAALVVRNGTVLLRSGYGMADMELGVAMRPEHVFRIGSITKQFTGVATLMLAQQGRLSLDDPLTKFLPDYPMGGRTVTVRQLLGHTSGIASYTSLPEWAPTRRTDKSVDEIIALFRDRPFDFEPGERWSYNNSGYILLGAIIERVSGMTYADFVEQRIFAPLGMTSSFYGDVVRIIPDRLPGYSRTGDGWRNAEYLSMTHPYAAGSLLSTVDDLARWNAAIGRGALLDAAHWREAFTPVRLNDGTSTGYAAGWMVGRVGRFAAIEHGGGINGFSTNAISVPDAGLFVVVLANADGPLGSPGELSLRLAQLVLGAEADEPAVAMPEARLREYVGVYRVSDVANREITLEDGVLYSQRTGGNRIALRPIGEDLFLITATGGRLRFERRDGAITGHVLEPRAGMAERATRTDEAPGARPEITLPSAAYDAYVGAYAMNENFRLRISRDGDRLFVQAPNQPAIPLAPQSPTRFVAAGVEAVLEFHFEGERVVAMTLHQGGRSMRMPRE
jgi:D-alanyl-D-alanine carboxypeptidase